MAFFEYELIYSKKYEDELFEVPMDDAEATDEDIQKSEEIIDEILDEIDEREVDERRERLSKILACAAINLSRSLRIDLEIKKYPDRISAEFRSLAYFMSGLIESEFGDLIRMFDEISIIADKEGAICVDMVYYLFEKGQ